MPYPARERDAARRRTSRPSTIGRAAGAAPTRRRPDDADARLLARGATLAPTSWSPLVAGDRHQLRLGAAAGGGDVLGYHAYALSATWLADQPRPAP